MGQELMRAPAGARLPATVLALAVLVGCGNGGPPELQPAASDAVDADGTPPEADHAETDGVAAAPGAPTEPEAEPEPEAEREPEAEPEPELPSGVEVVPGIFLRLPDHLDWAELEAPPSWDERPSVWAASVPGAFATDVRITRQPSSIDEELQLVAEDDRLNREIEPGLPEAEVTEVVVPGADRAVRIGDVSISGDTGVRRQAMQVGDEVITVWVSQYVEDMFEFDLDFDGLLDTVALVPERLA
jgi:predicted small lipoprotein YifL